MQTKKYLLVLLAAIIGVLIPSTIRFVKPYLEERLPDTFSLNRIAMDIESDLPRFEPMDLSELANQNFRYLGHGGQAVAFASDDGLYVLKFFLTKALHGEKRFPIPKPTHLIPSHRKARREKRAQTRMNSLLFAMRNYAVAYEKIKDKTGILYLHLVPSNGALPQVTLVDQSGNTHLVDLNRASFVFQKKATLVKEKLASLPDESKQEILSSLHQFFAERAKSGFIDVERSFMIEANYGFLGNDPIQLDVGNIEYLEELKAAPEKEIERMQNLLNTWAKNL